MTASPRLRAFALAAGLLAAGCSDGDGNENDPTGPAATLLVEVKLDAGGGVIVVTDGADPVAGATVQLNGTAGGPGASEGQYEVRLPAPVAAGGVMALEVRHADRVVRGSATVPETPVLTGVYSADSFDPAFPVQITWSSATNPERFEAMAFGSSTRTFSVDGAAARAYTIPAGTLGGGEWDIRVRAINNGIMEGDQASQSSMVVEAEGATSTSILLVPRLLIQADLDDSSSSTSLILDGLLVDGASVTVNGEAATQAAPGEPYIGHLATHASVGDPLTLSVAVGAETYAASGNVPETPVVTAHNFGTAIQVVWTSVSDPDRFAVTISGYTLSSHYTATYDVAGTSRSLIIPGQFIVGKYRLSVHAVEDGAFTGSVRPGSRMGIRARASLEL